MLKENLSLTRDSIGNYNDKVERVIFENNLMALKRAICYAKVQRLIYWFFVNILAKSVNLSKKKGIFLVIVNAVAYVYVTYVRSTTRIIFLYLQVNVFKF